MILKWFFSQIIQLMVIAVIGIVFINYTIGMDTLVNMLHQAKDGLSMIRDLQSELGNFDINSMMNY
ncbi:hypothetical protein [Paenibacillus luteus]|uniref:hypothetical protein n=1 Tax=Paenibacillus luteus TaxID=2545753 RepID=UPI0011441D77|nr:hypothetical protein [Paenibacillus luteus]